MPEQALVIVPTYNERENIARLIERVLAQDRRIEILIVDDGSPDGTGEIVDGIVGEESRVHIFDAPKKMGLGTAYIAGFRWALERGLRRTSSRWTPTSRTIPIHLPQFLERHRERRPRARLEVSARGEVTVVNWPIDPPHPQLLREHLRARRDRASGLGRDGRLQVLSQVVLEAIDSTMFARTAMRSRSR